MLSASHKRAPNANIIALDDEMIDEMDMDMKWAWMWICISHGRCRGYAREEDVDRHAMDTHMDMDLGCARLRSTMVVLRKRLLSYADDLVHHSCNSIMPLVSASRARMTAH